MERDWTEQDNSQRNDRNRLEAVSWKEILDQAITGIMPVDQAIELVIDRIERGRS